MEYGMRDWKRDCAGLGILAGTLSLAGIGLIASGGTAAPAIGAECCVIAAMFAPGFAWKLRNPPSEEG